MLEVRANHCLFEIPYINSICALGGKDSKEVETYDFLELLDVNDKQFYDSLEFIRFKEVNSLHPENIEDISFTFLVSKFDRSKDDKS